MTLTPGTTLGPYTIRAELGHGGMGVVYTAHDLRLKRQVAIKLLTADLTRDETATQRFLQEAQAASALDHPKFVQILASTKPSTPAHVGVSFVDEPEPLNANGAMMGADSLATAISTALHA